MTARRIDTLSLGAGVFCDHRCFVYREVVVGGEVVWRGHMATCEAGAKHSRSVLGQDFTTAHNPYAEAATS